LRGINMWFGNGIEFLPYIPEIFLIVAGSACEVWTRLIHHGKLYPFSVSLLRACDINMHPVILTVAVSVKLRLHPQSLADPGAGIFQCRYLLRFTVYCDRYHSGCLHLLLCLGLHVCRRLSRRFSFPVFLLCKKVRMTANNHRHHKEYESNL